MTLLHVLAEIYLVAWNSVWCYYYFLITIQIQLTQFQDSKESITIKSSYITDIYFLKVKHQKNMDMPDTKFFIFKIRSKQEE